MKKILFLSLGLFSLALVGCGNKQEQEIQEPQTNTIKLTPQEIENPDFRNVKRGMTIEEVKKQEGEIMMQSEDKLVYYVHINGNDYGLLYQFYNDELVGGMLILNGDNIVNSANHIDIFEDLGDMYIKKYGDTELKNRIDSPFDNDRSNWGLALDVGALTFMYEWETPTTIIEMYVTNFGDGPTVSVNHKSKELYSKFEEKQQSNELNKI